MAMVMLCSARREVSKCGVPGACPWPLIQCLGFYVDRYIVFDRSMPACMDRPLSNVLNNSLTIVTGTIMCPRA